MGIVDKLKSLLKSTLFFVLTLVTLYYGFKYAWLGLLILLISGICST